MVLGCIKKTKWHHIISDLKDFFIFGCYILISYEERAAKTRVVTLKINNKKGFEFIA